MSADPAGKRQREEIARFGALANRWWDPNGPQRAAARTQSRAPGYVAQRAAAARRARARRRLRRRPAVRGAGARRRAGHALDLAPELSKWRSCTCSSRAAGRLPPGLGGSAGGADAGSFDAVTCMEMLEHVPDPGSVLQACATLLKPGGRCSCPRSTARRWPSPRRSSAPSTWPAAAQGHARIPQLHPSLRTRRLAARRRLRLDDVSGLAYDPVRRKAWVNARTDINYLACAVKE
jgi:2-polyprenyl-6-hydroxyphenyl methylase/3-demethylubiquinone-9 3-methyltransferase